MSHDTPVTDPRHMDKRSNEHIRCFRTGLYKEAERLIKGGRYEGVFLEAHLGFPLLTAHFCWFYHIFAEDEKHKKIKIYISSNHHQPRKESLWLKKLNKEKNTLIYFLTENKLWVEVWKDVQLHELFLGSFWCMDIKSLVRLLSSLPVGSLLPYFCQNSCRTSCTHGHHSSIHLFTDSSNTHSSAYHVQAKWGRKAVLIALWSNSLGLKEVAFKD